MFAKSLARIGTALPLLSVVAASVISASAYGGDPYLGAKPVSKTPFAYLGEGLRTEPLVRMRPSILPTTDELAGKQFIFTNGDKTEDWHKVGGNMVRFVDGKKVEYHGYCCPEMTGTPEVTASNYVAFKVAPGIFFVTFIEERGKWREQQLVSFILNLNQMNFTDSFAEDDFGHGELYWMLVQGSLVEIKSDDPRYGK